LGFLEGSAGEREVAVGPRCQLALMRDDQERAAALDVELLQEVSDSFRRVVVEVARRLVGEEDPRRVCDRSSDGDALSFSARELRWPMVGSPCEADAVEKAVSVAPAALDAYAGERECQLDVLHGGERLEEAEMLEDKTDDAPAELCEVVAGQRREIAATDDDLALLRALQAAEYGKQGRLARARRADERDILPFPDVERDIAQDLDVFSAPSSVGVRYPMGVDAPDAETLRHCLEGWARTACAQRPGCNLPPMRMSQMFGSTLRAAPSTSEVAGHQLLLRGGYVRQVGAGIFAFLPLGLRVMRRLEAIARQEMEAVGGQELSLPVVLPAELWKRSGRFDSVGPELIRLKDRRGRDLILAMTHEEVVAALAATEVQSWRQLPRLVFQIQTKFRDDPRPRAGLVRTREFTMKDAYSLDRDEEGLSAQYGRVFEAYVEVFRRCKLPCRPVESDVGMMGGSLAHEFMYLAPIGEDTIVLCDGCGYAKNRQVARAALPPVSAGELQPLERVETPGTTTIDSLAALLGMGADETAKIVFVMASVAARPLSADARAPAGSEAPVMVAGGAPGREIPVVAVVRGDKTVNETKLANAVRASELRPMSEDEIRAIGCVPGYASPMGVGARATVVVDYLVAASTSLVAGANEEGWHLLGMNAGRDYTPDVVTDITAVVDGDACVVCGDALRTERGVEVGNIFQLGTQYAEYEGASYLDETGVERPIFMGCYGLGIGRLLGCLAEEHHDDRGVCWPAEVAPFDVHVLAIGEESALVAGEIHDALEDSGREVLWDDRGERAGVQFADADLVGAPLRVTVSPRSLAAGGVEVKLRTSDAASVIDRGELLGWLSQQI
jgi:prolyl-tRNA synthetase